MKKILLSSMIAAAAAVPAIAGVNNINYQAVITDANGVMADKKVEMKFELLDKSDNVVYTEEQTPTTSANGMVVCQLGKDDELSTIEWGDLTLRVSMKVGNSYEVISNEAVSSVPTALYALKSADSDMLIEEVTRINTEADEMRSNLNSLGADVAQIEGLSEQVEEITSAVEELVQETELNKETIIGINAEIVKLNGLSDDLENLQENLTNSFTAVDAQIEEINGQLENLNNVAGVTRANEEAIEEMNTNLDSSFTMVETRFDKIQTQVDAQDKDIEDLKGQVENLNNVSAVTRANEQAIEELNTNLDSSFTMVETRFDKIQNQVDAQDKDIEDLKGQVENLNNVAAVTRANEEAIEELNTNLDSSFTMVETRFDKIQTQVDELEKLNESLDSSFTMVETRFDKIQTQVDETDKDVENIKENLTNSFTAVNAEIDDLKGQVENLNNVAAVTRANEEAIETLSDGVSNLEELTGENGRLMTLIKELQNQIATLQEEVKALKGE